MSDAEDRKVGVSVRDARPEELDDVTRLSVEAYAEFAPRLEPGGWERMREGISSVPQRDGSAVIVAKGRDGLAGSVVYFPPGSDAGGSYPKEGAVIRLLSVSPAQRGEGVGKALTEECLRRARVDGAAEVGLNTSQLMVAARSLYERMGFVVCRELPPLFGVRYWALSRRLD